MKHFGYCLVLLSFLITFPIVAQEQLSFLFVGHCSQIETAGTQVDYRVRQLNMSAYNGIWIGGDVCGESMLNYSTIQHIDTVFDLVIMMHEMVIGNFMKSLLEEKHIMLTVVMR